MSEDSLLDVFVDIDVRGQGESKAAIDAFLIAAKKAFGDVGDTQAKAANKGANAQVAAAQRSANAIAAAAQKSANAQIQSHALAQNAFLKGATVQQKAIGGLSNNAYQLGQAFEDAAVGFSLNGIQGAFRGAANNVTFLINNLAQAGTLTSVLGAKTASLLPLYFGIGTAALFILPVLYNWWKSLDDVEDKTRDISELMKREFEDIEFRVSMVLDAEEARKVIRDAETVADAIEQIIDRLNESADLKLKLRLEVDENFKNKALTRIRTDIFKGVGKDLNRRLQEELLNRENSTVVNPNTGKIVPGALTEHFDREIAKVKLLQKELERLGFAEVKIDLDVDEDITDPTAFKNAANAIQSIINGLDNVNLGLKKSPELLAAEKKALEDIRDKYEEQYEISKKIQQLESTKGFKVASDEAEKLTRELKFQQDIRDGIADKEDRILFTMREEEIAAKKVNDELLKRTGNSKEAQEIVDQKEKNDAIKHEAELIEEIGEIEKEVADARKDANKAAESAAKRRLELEKRIAKEEIDGQQEVANAEGELQAEIQRQAGTAAEERIQDQIQALQDAGEVTSQQFQLGDIGQVVDSGTDGNKEKIKALQKELEDLRDTKKVAADAARIQELQDRIVQERQEAREKLNDLREDLEDAKKGEVEAINEAAEEINKMTEQLRQLREALQKNAQGENTTLKGFADEAKADAAKVAANAGFGNRADGTKKGSGFFGPLKMQDGSGDVATEISVGVEFDGKEIEIPTLVPTLTQEQVDFLLKGGDPLQNEKIIQRAIEHAKIRIKNGLSPFADKDSALFPGPIRDNLPLDNDKMFEARKKLEQQLEQQQKLQASGDIGFIDARQLGIAQAQANARAMENTDFTSTTLQTLLTTTNDILTRLDSNVTKLDTSARFT